MQTICSAGLRVSEIKYVTVEAVKSGLATIDCKGKIRQVFLPKALCQMLKAYIKERKIKSGSVFVTRTGKPLNRSNIWKMMSALCEAAKVSKEKVFPHNLRHLFARTFYKVKKDIVRLADILGHSSVNTTRIYTMERANKLQLKSLSSGYCLHICDKLNRPTEKCDIEFANFSQVTSCDITKGWSDYMESEDMEDYFTCTQYSEYIAGLNPDSGEVRFYLASQKPHNINIDGDIENGKIEADAKSAQQWTTVKVTPTPDEGYECTEVTATDSEGNSVTVYHNDGEADWSFDMPLTDVTVTAKFELAE